VEALERRNRNAFAQILGELRLGAADIMFVKTERYLHGGVAYRPHLDAGALAREGVARARPTGGADRPSAGEEPDSDVSGALAALVGPMAPATPSAGLELEETEADHEAVETIIRSAESDFRGFIGNLEREIKPWRPKELPHQLSPGRELLPWVRLMTLANPGFVRAYRTGAWWLSSVGHPDQALAFLDEGIAKNQDHPELFQLYLSKVQVLLGLALRGEADRLEPALAAVRAGIAQGLKARPADGVSPPGAAKAPWSEDHEEDLAFLLRFEPLILERLGRTEAARRAAEAGLVVLPDDPVLARLSDRMGKADPGAQAPIR